MGLHAVMTSRNQIRFWATAGGQDLSLPVSAACLRKDHCAISLSSSARMKGPTPLKSSLF